MLRSVDTPFMLHAYRADLVRLLLPGDARTRLGGGSPNGRATVNASGVMPFSSAGHVVGGAIGKPGRARGEYVATAVVPRPFLKKSTNRRPCRSPMAADVVYRLGCIAATRVANSRVYRCAWSWDIDLSFRGTTTWTPLPPVSFGQLCRPSCLSISR